ncbi:DUF11 domain-containing protein [Candidatus Bipolaricaulota bacterium]|nr:DUF11 domain-containing protein [Candidatus Bipolaricaulota bacterium]
MGTRRKIHTEGRRSWALALLLLVAISVSGAVSATETCDKLPDLWFPEPGVGLSGGELSVQMASPTVVVQGETVTVTVTVDNFTCGATGPFELALYADTLEEASLIGTRTLSLESCEHAIVEFTWNTAGTAAGEHDLIASADPDNDVPEYHEDDNTYTLPETVIVFAAPVIEVDKAALVADDGCLRAGEEIEYEITVSNIGEGDHTNGATIRLEDRLPVETALVDGSLTASIGSASSPEQGLVVWSGHLAAGGAATIRFSVIVDPETPIDAQIINQAFADWDRDQDGTRDAEEPSDDPSTSIEDDATVLVVGECVDPADLAPLVAGTIDAPSLTEWGLIGMGVGMLLAFAWMLWRHRPHEADGLSGT